jgi:AraC-like DNA-binding protein
MKIHFISPYDELKPYIRSMWVFESPVGMPASDVNIAAPNGCPKLIVQLENSIISTVDGEQQESPSHAISFVGNRDVPVSIHTPRAATLFIGIEFQPHGAFPLFGIPMTETANALLPVDLLLPSWGTMISERLCAMKTVDEQIGFIQDQLVTRVRNHLQVNPCVDYCVHALQSSHGIIPIADLERKTGYSRRHLELLFNDYVGFSPKVLGNIFRFQKFYRTWAHGKSFTVLKKELYDYYYDQAHFSKEFKKMTGYSPLHYASKVTNEFGRQLSLH